MAYYLHVSDDALLAERDHDGHTALMWAAYQGDHLTVGMLLEFACCDINARDSSGLSALHWAMTRGQLSTLDKLVQAGALLDVATNDGKTPAAMADEMQCSDVWREALLLNNYSVYCERSPVLVSKVWGRRRRAWDIDSCRKPQTASCTSCPFSLSALVRACFRCLWPLWLCC